MLNGDVAAHETVNFSLLHMTSQLFAASFATASLHIDDRGMCLLSRLIRKRSKGRKGATGDGRSHHSATKADHLNPHIHDSGELYLLNSPVISGEIALAGLSL